MAIETEGIRPRQADERTLSFPRVLISDLCAHGKESVICQAASCLAGPAKSLGQLGLYKLGRRPDLELYFGKTIPVIEPERKLDSLPDVLRSVKHRLALIKFDHEHNFLKELYPLWLQVRKGLQTEIGADRRIIDYLIFDPERDQTVLFYAEETNLNSLVIPDAPFDKASVADQLASPLASFELPEPPEWTTAIDDRFPDPAEAVGIELAIQRMQEQLGIDNATATNIRVSSISNEFRSRKHKLFDRDGEMFTDLRHLGADSIGELQELQRQLTTYGINYDSASEEVKVDSELSALWTAIRHLSIGERENASEVASEELNRFAEEVMYFEMSFQYFTENPAIVDDLLHSGLYLQYEKVFKDHFLASRGLTERDVATAMLANVYLYHFEGADSLSQSNSQATLADIDGFHENIEAFLATHSDTPSLLQDPSERPVLLAELAQTLKRMPLSEYQFEPDRKQKVLADAQRSYDKVQAEMRRHKIARRAVDAVKKVVPIIEDEAETTKPFRLYVANMGMARVPGEGRFTAQSYMPYSDRYMPDGFDIHPFDHQEATTSNVRDALRYVLNGQTLPLNYFDGDSYESAYESQVSRIYTEGSVILDFLQTDPQVPPCIKDVMNLITSDEFMVRITEKFGHAQDQDPNVVDRFFQDDIEAFRTFVLHRYVTDFVRGVETQLINQTLPLKERLKRKWYGAWTNHDFSHVSQEDLEMAVQSTLEKGEHRIKKLNHETEERKTFKDRQEYVEKNFLWDSNDTKFERWEKYWDFLNTVGGAWDCICFIRKTVFNPDVFQQY